MASFSRKLKVGVAAGTTLSSKVLAKTPLRSALAKSAQKQLSELRAIPSKVAQISQMSSKEAAEIIHTPALTLQEIEKQRGKSLGFDEKSYTGIVKAASLGQVFQVNENNQLLALKVRFPDSKEKMDLDNDLFSWITELFGTFKKGFALNSFQEELRSNLERELDYVSEASVQSKFFQFFENTNIVIPKVYPSQGEDTILMSWEESLDIGAFSKKASILQKQQAASLLTQFYLDSLFGLGIVHTDPNPGNIGFRITQDEVFLVVYDFGGVCSLDLKTRSLLYKLFQGKNLGNQGLLRVLENLGFESSIDSIANYLEVFFEIILEPMLSLNKYQLKNWNRKERIEGLLGENRFQFMIAAPPLLFPLMRMFQGFYFYHNQLEADVFASNILHKYSSHFDNDLELLKKETFITSSDGPAKNLVVHIQESGVSKVKVSLPRMAVENLATVVGSDILEKLNKRNINLEEIVKKVRANGFGPMVLFRLEDGNKIFEVTLL